jgi:small subunit ribosomal protein S6
MEYELTVLVHPDRESDLEKALTKVRDLVKSSGGQITNEDNWGKKRLAYRIKNQEFAVYVCLEVKLPADAPLKVSNALNISDDVIRYLLVKVDEKERVRIAAAKKNADNNEEESRERNGSQY